MGVQGSVTLTPQQLPGFLQQLGADLTHINEASFFKQVGLALENGAKDCFNDSKSPSNQPWSPLKHARPRGGNKPLLDRGLLRGSLTNNGQGHIANVSGDTLEWGTNLESALLQNFGGVITPKRGKFLCIPASVEAQRAGSPLTFPDAKKRLRWAFNKAGTGGIVYEKVSTSGNNRISGRSSKKQSKFMKSISRGLKKVKRFGKKLKRLKGKAMRAIRKSLAKIKRLTKKINSLQKKLRSGGLSYKTVKTLRDAIMGTQKQLKEAKAKHLVLKKGKDAKSGATKENKVMLGNKQVHYFLSKRVEIPAREFMGISDNTADVILAIAEDHIAQNVG